MYDSMTVVDTDELIELKKQAEEINKRIAAVSYTHLDVYKRQQRRRRQTRVRGKSLK